MTVANIHGGVAVMHCMGREVSGKWAFCYEHMMHQDAAGRNLVKAKGSSEGLYIAQNRNLLVEQFLTRKEEWLLFLDTDIIFTIEHFYSLYDAAVTNHCDVLGALYYTYLGQNQIFPAWLQMTADGTGHQQTVTSRIGGIQDVATVGMGFTLIHRRVLEALRDAKPKHKWAWFGHDEMTLPDGTIDCMGEDTTFCHRVRKLGFKIQGHSGVAVGHDKRVILTWESFDREQAWRLAEAKEAKMKESA